MVLDEAILRYTSERAKRRDRSPEIHRAVCPRQRGELVRYRVETLKRGPDYSD